MSDLHLGLAGVGRIGVMHARNVVTTPGVGRLTVADGELVPDRTDWSSAKPR